MLYMIFHCHGLQKGAAHCYYTIWIGRRRWDLSEVLWHVLFLRYGRFLGWDRARAGIQIAFECVRESINTSIVYNVQRYVSSLGNDVKSMFEYAGMQVSLDLITACLSRLGGMEVRTK